MRSEFRIDPFLKRVDIPKLVKKIKKDFPGWDNIDVDASVSEIFKAINNKDFLAYWKDNPDLRFGQLLFNLGVEIMDSIYNYEEPDILQLCGLSPTQSNYWISLLDKEGKLLETPVARFIDELDTSHLLKMVQENNEGVRLYSHSAIALFLMELTNRGIEVD